MNNISENINLVHKKIDIISRSCGRNPKDITLIAVSKNKSLEDINDAIKAGHAEFGENYAQEGMKKVLWFRHNKIIKKNITWHFIGCLQSNKTKLVAKYFDWFHALDNLKISKRLNSQRPSELLPLNVLIQINIQDNKNKSGIKPDQMLEFASSILECSRLKLRGIMIVTNKINDSQQRLKIFQHIFNIYQKLKSAHPNIDTLSLGTTEDMSEAILSGSTLLRIGTAIFGKRNK